MGFMCRLPDYKCYESLIGAKQLKVENDEFLMPLFKVNFSNEKAPVFQLKRELLIKNGLLQYKNVFLVYKNF